MARVSIVERGWELLMTIRRASLRESISAVSGHGHGGSEDFSGQCMCYRVWDREMVNTTRQLKYSRMLGFLAGVWGSLGCVVQLLTNWGFLVVGGIEGTDK